MPLPGTFMLKYEADYLNLMLRHVAQYLNKYIVVKFTFSFFFILCMGLFFI